MDDGQNSWDNGYPSGGNYWEDYTGTDNYHGPNQNLSGSDGIGDTPYNIYGGSNQDLYPFMEPNGWANEPPITPNIYGPDNGITGEAYFFNTTITDPDGDSLFCFWDWGDGNFTGWLGPYPSGVNISASHVWFSKGVYDIRAKLKDSYGSESNWSEPHRIIINKSGPPPEKPIIDGPSWGLTNINYTFCFTWANPDADDFYCRWDWGDGNITEWLGPYSASQTICANHSWSQKGTYEIYVKLKDIHGVEINSDPHLFTVYELKKEFIFGRYTNLTEEGGYSTIEAVKLRVLLFKPFQFLHYNDGEIVTFLKDTLKGLVLPRFIIGMVDVIT